MDKDKKRKLRMRIFLFFNLSLCMLLIVFKFQNSQAEGLELAANNETVKAEEKVEQEIIDSENIEYEIDSIDENTEYDADNIIEDDDTVMYGEWEPWTFEPEFEPEEETTSPGTESKKTTSPSTVSKKTTTTSSQSKQAPALIAADVEEEVAPFIKNEVTAKRINQETKEEEKNTNQNTEQKTEQKSETQNQNKQENKTETPVNNQENNKDNNKEDKKEETNTTEQDNTQKEDKTENESIEIKPIEVKPVEPNPNEQESKEPEQKEPDTEETPSEPIIDAGKKLTVTLTQRSGTTCIEYRDDETDEENPIRRYAYGYIGARKNSNFELDSYYRMTVLCGNNEIETVVKNVYATQDGRSFNFVLPTAGWYALMVIDEKKGSKFYEVYLNDEDVIIHTEEDVNMPRLQVEGKKITGLKGTSEESICYIKAAEDKNFTRGNTVRSYLGGELNVWTIDNEGLVYRLKVVLNSINANTEKIEKLMMQCEQNLSEYFKVSKEVYDTTLTPGFYAVDTYYDELQDLLSEAYILLGNVEGTQQDVDQLTEKITNAYKALQKNEKEIKPGLVTVIGDTIIVTIPPIYDLEYIIYNIQEGTRDVPLAVVQNDWTGIAVNKYRKVTQLDNNNQFILENVEDGVYTFMIKVARTESGVTKSYIYFENPIVSEHEDDIYFSLRKLMGDEDSAVARAQKTLYSVVKKSAQTGKLGELVVSDTLYKSLEKEITTAKNLASTIGEKILEGIATSEDAKSILTEIARLNTIERKVIASIEKTVIEQTIIVSCENKEKGEYLITNLEGGLVRVYVASGKHTTWNEFARAGYMSVKIDDNKGIKTAAFEVNKNGYYTIYCKFEDNTYKFLQIMEDGYGGENWKEEEKPVEKEARPIVNTGACTEAGMSIILDTSKNNIRWSAFSEGKYNSWKEMLQNNQGGIHYIAQNESVLIPTWTDTNVSYTFFFKGNSNDSDYIVTISGTNNKKVSTVDESFYEED